MLCSRDLAITISAATIYHEVAQEVADYFMLTRFCHIPPIKALGLNFVNGLSVLFGACLIVGIDDITNVAVGSILGVSGGVYIYIAVAECFPRAKLAQKTLKDKLMSLLAFVFGVIPIGLVLMNHGHCEAGGHDDH
jgi:zinc transporter ZupT